MENTDNTFLEMQQQLQQLKEKLESQKIVNDNILKRSMRKNLVRLRIKANVPVLAAFAMIMLSPMIYNMGASIYLTVFTVLIVVAGALAATFNNSRLPRMDKDLVSQMTDLLKFRKMNADWIKFSFPVLGIWVVWFVLEVFNTMGLNDDAKLGALCGLACGIVIGTILGLKNRRDLLEGTDDLLNQINDLTNNR